MTFKVGDRVKYTGKWWARRLNNEATILSLEGDSARVRWSDGDTCWPMLESLELVKTIPTDEELAKTFRESLLSNIEALKGLQDRGYKVVFSTMNGSSKITKTTVKEL